VETFLQLHHAFFHTIQNYTCLYAISSHRLAALPPMMSAFNSHKHQNAFYYFLSKPLKICCHVLLRTKKQHETIRLPVSQPDSAGKRAKVGELQAHYCMRDTRIVNLALV